jgi:hypothetical protein
LVALDRPRDANTSLSPPQMLLGVVSGTLEQSVDRNNKSKVNA